MRIPSLAGLIWPLILGLGLVACGGSDKSGAAGPAVQVKPAQVAVAPEVLEIYNRSCISCHSSGAGGAPRTGDLADWEPRVALGMELLLEHTFAGFKGMPPMGMCMDCNEEQFVALIEYMAGQPLQ